MFYFGLHNQRFGWWQHLRHAAFLGMHDSVQGSSANVLTGGKVTFGTAGFDLQYDTASFISNPIVSSKQWRENISTENKARQLIFCEQSIKVVFIYGMPFFCVALFGFSIALCVFFMCYYYYYPCLSECHSMTVANLSDDIWVVIHDILGSPRALATTCKQLHALLNLRYVRCRLDGPYAVHRILSMRGTINHLIIQSIDCNGIGLLRW